MSFSGVSGRGRRGGEVYALFSPRWPEISWDIASLRDAAKTVLGHTDSNELRNSHLYLAHKTKHLLLKYDMLNTSRMEFITP